MTRKNFMLMVAIVVITGAIMLAFVYQRSYYKSLLLELKEKQKTLNQLENQNKKLSYELEKYTTAEFIIGKSITKFKPGINRIKIIENEKVE